MTWVNYYYLQISIFLLWINIIYLSVWDTQNIWYHIYRILVSTKFDIIFHISRIVIKLWRVGGEAWEVGRQSFLKINASIWVHNCGLTWSEHTHTHTDASILLTYIAYTIWYAVNEMGINFAESICLNMSHSNMDWCITVHNASYLNNRVPIDISVMHFEYRNHQSSAYSTFCMCSCVQMPREIQHKCITSMANKFNSGLSIIHFVPLRFLWHVEYSIRIRLHINTHSSRFPGAFRGMHDLHQFIQRCWKLNVVVDREQRPQIASTRDG